MGPPMARRWWQQTPFLIVVTTLVVCLLLMMVMPPLSNQGEMPTTDNSRPSSTNGETVTGPVEPATLDRPIPDVTLVSQTGESVSLAKLRGSVWIAGFIYTRCHTSCPQVSATMSQLRDVLPEEVKFVSLSVDPRHDTPEILANYAKNFAADPKRWLFLTGERDTIYRVIREGFAVMVEENTDPRTIADDLVIHSNRLTVVDRDGIARSSCLSSDPGAVDQLKRTVKKYLEVGRAH